MAGWNRDNKNGMKLAENAGIQALAVHGRTREDRYNGEAEYDTIAAIRDAIKIPLLANGDITDPLENNTGHSNLNHSPKSPQTAGFSLCS